MAANRWVRTKGQRATAVLAAGALATALAVAVTGAGASAATGGQGWAPVAAPLPAGSLTPPNAAIKSTACPTQGYCVAVGDFASSAGATRTLPLVEVLSAGTWTDVPLALPAGATHSTFEAATLDAVSCAAPGSCVAVGNFADTSGGIVPMIAAATAGTWAAYAAPLPSGAATGPTVYAYLTSVSCPSAGFCVAAGQYDDATKQEQALVDTGSGPTWTASTAPEPPGFSTGHTKYAELDSVTCPADGDCTAAGTYVTGGHTSALLETLASGTWTATTGPVPAGAGPRAHLNAVSCSGPGACTAVGWYTLNGGGDDGLAETLAAGRWSASEVAIPSNALPAKTEYVTVTGVSCTAPGVCTATGEYMTPTAPNYDNGAPLLATLSAGTWTAADAPLTGTAIKVGHLRTVSCSAPGVCTAVGAHTPGTTHPQALLETRSGGAWTGQSASLPFGTASGPVKSAGLTAVNCMAGTCAAGGWYIDSATGQHGLLETAGTAPAGYFEAASDGGIFAFTVPFHGSMGGKPLNAPIVYAADDPITGGYYEVASDGGIFAFTAPFHGSMGGKPLNKPIVGMAFDTRTGGYYLVASDGGLFAFTAPFLGSMGGKPLNQPIVGMAFDPTTGGYWEVAADGGLFAFTAPFLGSMGGKPLNEPIVGMTYDSLTNGYYEVATDGGLFAFTAPFHGSMGGKPLNEPVVGMAFDYGTGGYWEVASDGGLFSFTAPFLGSMGGKPLNEPIVTMALG